MWRTISPSSNRSFGPPRCRVLYGLDSSGPSIWNARQLDKARPFLPTAIIRKDIVESNRGAYFSRLPGCPALSRGFTGLLHQIAEKIFGGRGLPDRVGHAGHNRLGRMLGTRARADRNQSPPDRRERPGQRQTCAGSPAQRAIGTRALVSRLA